MIGPLPAAQLASIRRILFVRSDRIGDAIVSTPALQALRARFPDAEIDVVLGRKNTAVAPLLPFVDRILIAQGVTASARAIWAMRRRRYDIAINPLRSQSTTATLLTRWSGARITIGFATAPSNPYDIAVPLPDGPMHFVKRYMLPLAALGIALPDEDAVRLSIRLPAEAGEAARAAIGARTAKRLAMINISCSAQEKFWGVENFSRLAGEMKTSGLDVLVVAAPGDATLLSAVAGRSVTRALMPCRSLTDFAALISCADMMVSPDTSVVHLAAALGKPVVALEPTALNVVEWHPWGVPYRAPNHGAGIADIPYAIVADAVRSLVAEVF